MLRPALLALALALAVLSAVDTVNAQTPAQPHLIHRVYPVADLVITVDSKPSKSMPALVQVAEVQGQVPTAKNLPPTCEKQLINMIESCIATKSWTSAGGTGTIAYLPGTFALVVHQTPEIHEKVEELLDSLRRLQKVQVAMDIKIVTVSDRMYEHIAKEFDLNQNPSKLLNKETVAKIVESFTGDRRTVVLSAPKITTLNGQESCISVGEERFFCTGLNPVLHNGTPTLVPTNERFNTGSKITVQSTVTTDQKNVIVKLHAEVSELAESTVPLFPITTYITPTFEGGAVGQPIPFTQFVQQPTIVTRAVNKVMGIPEGQSGFIYAGRCNYSIRHVHRVPVLGDLPLVGDLFMSESNGVESNHLIFIVTPKVVVANATETPTAAARCCDRDLPVIPKPDVANSGRLLVPAPVTQATGPSRVAPKPIAVPVETLQALDNSKLPLPLKPMESKAGSTRIEELMTKYRAACAEGRKSDAKRLAGKLIEIDPTCFAPTEK